LPNITGVINIKNQIGGACSTCWGREKVHSVYWSVKLKAIDDLEDQGEDGKIILEWIVNIK
jgi:hypothetical protein